MKKYDNEAAKAGAAVMTRSGHDVRIICFDKMSRDSYCIVALVDYSGVDVVETYDNEGVNDVMHKSNLDLVMKPVKKTYWFARGKADGADNIFYWQTGLYDSEQALRDALGSMNLEGEIKSEEIEE